jgi:glutathione S-transferase
LTFPKYNEELPKSILTTLEAKAPAFYKWANATIKEKSVYGIYDEQKVAERTAQRLKKLAAAK